MTAARSKHLDGRVGFDPADAHDRAVRAALRERLLALSFHAFEELVRELLTRLGYSDARLLGRTALRQCTRHGGADLEAFTEVGVSRNRIIFQVKQYRRKVSRRFVDELGGVVLRSGAREGIILTTSSFSQVARTVASRHAVAKLRLIDGVELLDLLFRYGPGVRREGRAGRHFHELDAAYFDRIAEQYPKTVKARCIEDPSASERGRLTPAATLPRIDSQSNLPPMLWRTHLLAGIDSLWLLYAIPGALTASSLPPALLLAALGALLPDLDATESKVKHLGAFGITPFAPLSVRTHQAFGHRGILHAPIALAAIALVSAILSFWIGVVPGISLLLGYGSHLVMDALTCSGISALPFSKRRLHLLPPGLRLVTGSRHEDLLMLLLGFLSVLLLLHFLSFSPFHP